MAAGREIRLFHDHRSRHRDGGRFPVAAQRLPDQLAAGRHAVLDPRRARGEVRVPGQFLQFHQNTTSQQGGIVTFPNLAAFLQGQPSNVDFAVPGLIDPDPRLQAVAVRVLRAGRRAAATEPLAESGPAVRVHHDADGSEREDLEPAERDRHGADGWRAVAHEPVAEEHCAAAGHRLGSDRQRLDVGPRRVRPLLRRDPAEVLLLLRQPEPAVHDAHHDREPAVPERHGEFQPQRAGSARSCRRSTSISRRPTSRSSTPACSRRCRATGTSSSATSARAARIYPSRRRQPRARNDRERRQDVSDRGGPAESELRRRSFSAPPMPSRSTTRCRSA